MRDEVSMDVRNLVIEVCLILILTMNVTISQKSTLNEQQNSQINFMNLHSTSREFAISCVILITMKENFQALA